MFFFLIQHLIHSLPEFLQSFIQYLNILDRVITALDCICQTMISMHLKVVLSMSNK